MTTKGKKLEGEDLRKGFMKKILMPKTVLEAAKERIRRLFDEFENVVVSYSGGKDSTIVLELTLEIAREKGRLPQKVMFLDQEGEWQATIDMVKEVMYREEVEPMWMQIPFKIFNATSFTNHWLECWGEGQEWMREKDPCSRKENIYGTDRFVDLFTHILDKEVDGQRACYIGGVRTEESPTRLMGLTNALTYKDIAWGKKLNDSKGQYIFYPIYDWSYIDVWKAIHDHEWKYCKVYDSFYQYGVSINAMRVSNLNHETAVKSLFILQEIEPETYAKMTQRLEGVDMAGKMSHESFFCPKELPYMFSDWAEYRDYLLENLIEDKWQEQFKKKFEIMDDKFGASPSLCRKQISSILTNDHEFVKLNNIRMTRKEHALWQARKYSGDNSDQT